MSGQGPNRDDAARNRNQLVCFTHTHPTSRPLLHHRAPRKLQELHIDGIAARAKRANERVKESAARKLRLEAAKVEKASQAIERAKTHADAKLEERVTLREAAKARRETLLQGVRETRAARQAERLAHQAALSELEDKACAKRAKTVMVSLAYAPSPTPASPLLTHQPLPQGEFPPKTRARPVVPEA